jgi:ABC-type transport system involved in multi-copper enzyme maturation permease subunit
MDASATAAPKGMTNQVNRFLPYWAVFQMDVHQTLTNWIYRLWVLLTLATAAGFLLYRYGAKEMGGLVSPAHDIISQLLKWVVHGGVTLVIVLTAGTICGERGTMADSVLSRGISRNQYFLGKWHARLAVILATFFIMAIAALVASYFMLNSDNLTLNGSLVALLAVAALLTLVITCSVTVSALANSTMVSVAIVWLVLYGAGFLLSLMPNTFPSPDAMLQNLPNILRGMYDWNSLSRMIVWMLTASAAVALFGLFSFSRKDV